MNELLRIAACEDKPEDANLLARRIRESGTAAKLFVFASGEAFMREYRKGLYHLIILDIYMESLTGMDVAAAIREQGDSVPIAFITTSKEHALEANRYRSILYIEKPVTAEAVGHTLSVAEAIRQKRANDILPIVDHERKKLNISFDTISYIEVLNHRCTVHLADGGEVKVRTATTIDELNAALPSPRFFRCHRSFIVNFDYVKETDDYFSFIMAGGDRALARIKDFNKMKTAYEDYLYAASREAVK